MGKMKELFIDQMNKDRGVPDDTDWKYKQEESKVWLVKSIKDDCIYRIHAESYERALELLPMIENF